MEKHLKRDTQSSESQSFAKITQKRLKILLQMVCNELRTSVILLLFYQADKFYSAQKEMCFPILYTKTAIENGRPDVENVRELLAAFLCAKKYLLIKSHVLQVFQIDEK